MEAVYSPSRSQTNSISTSAATTARRRTNNPYNVPSLTTDQELQQQLHQQQQQQQHSCQKSPVARMKNESPDDMSSLLPSEQGASTAAPSLNGLSQNNSNSNYRSGSNSGSSSAASSTSSLPLVAAAPCRGVPFSSMQRSNHTTPVQPLAPFPSMPLPLPLLQNNSSGSGALPRTAAYRVGPAPPPAVLTEQLGVQLFDLPVGLPDRNMSILCRRHLECPGRCALGPQVCPYRHITRGHTEFIPTQQCIYYHQSGGTCRKEKCGFFHGPLEMLQHMQHMQMVQQQPCKYLLESVLPIRDAQAEMIENLRAEAAAPPPPYSLAVAGTFQH